MNQAQIISRLAKKDYKPALTTEAYTIMTRPIGAEHTGQVVFKNGIIKTLRSVDAGRVTNKEEINMKTYYTQKQLNEMTEAERTALYNERTGSNITRMRNKAKAVTEILAEQEVAKLVVKQEKENPSRVPIKDFKQTVAKPRKQGIAATLLAMLKKSSAGLTAEQASHLIGGKVVTAKLAISHIRTGRVDGTKHIVNLDRKTGIYTYENN